MSVEPSASATISRSQEQLQKLLRTFPTRASILFASHRPAIINLAQTCHELHAILTHAIPRLINLFPQCKKQRPCAVCKTPCCIGCSGQVVVLGHSAVLLSYNGCIYTVVSGGKHACGKASREAPKRSHHWLCRESHGLYFEHCHAHSLLCDSCAPTPRDTVGKVVPDKRPEWVGHSFSSFNSGDHLSDPTKGLAMSDELIWEEIPRADSTCTCPEFDLECEASIHLVRVASAPRANRLTLFAWLPRGLHQGAGYRNRKKTYVMRIPPEAPFRRPRQYRGVLRLSFLR